ncbi:winged helix-turn-helix transcriptional regulator [Maribacter polysiphoniae]|uniref:ArsR family transcriptional regulator n=1 Tax=Maribacter polysiphoniae TaxID=429344 RepID=A0A316E1M4_9FLAO|nr:metalloregulator ArsR/SmtB family transcription factor [Maribacter polysiphoniae]MBD1258974.1 winged helix-turn-helix transcriptional regulator [Maribacter polysiphoniae]PWK24527.1 ArsR family transcriptional regulator [Maribacter polysiphoniae]
MDEHINIFKALSDATRLKIIWLLTNIDEKICVSEIVEVLDEYQYNVSRHLKILKHAKLVEEVKEGKWVYYYLTPIKNEFRQLIQEAIKTIPESQMNNEIQKCKRLLAERHK